VESLVGDPEEKISDADALARAIQPHLLLRQPDRAPHRKNAALSIARFITQCACALCHTPSLVLDCGGLANTHWRAHRCKVRSVIRIGREGQENEARRPNSVIQGI
jgi:hypothetical protein